MIFKLFRYYDKLCDQCVCLVLDKQVAEKPVGELSEELFLEYAGEDKEVDARDLKQLLLHLTQTG